MNNGVVVQFGAFELHTDTGELRRHGVKVRLQGKPLHLLQALLDRPGVVVTREELRDRLWTVDTFVDFESGMNTAMNRLRLALGDSAEHPRYIETLARNGYRFLAPVSEAHPAPVSPMSPLSPMSDDTAPAVHSPAAPSEVLPASSRTASEASPHRWPIAAAAVAILLAGSGWLVLLRQQPAVQAVFHQVTFRRVTIRSARFGPDGESAIYEARTGPRDRELYLVNTVSPESRPLGFPGAMLVSVSRSGELALMTVDSTGGGRSLVRVPINGGAPLALDRGIYGADWSPDGSRMAVIRYARNETLEYPRGKTMFQSSGWLADLRVSPSGKEVAFIEHPMLGDDGGNITLIDEKGVSHTLSAGWASVDGLAWAPSGREVWFTAAHSGVIRSLYAVSLSGKLRLVASYPGTLTLFDISRSGRVLVSREQVRMMMAGTVNGGSEEKDFSWFDYSHAMDISADGRAILFDETGEGGGPHHSTYIRRSDAPSAVRIGEGFAMAISPDGNWAVTMTDGDQASVNLVPLTPGQPRILSGHGLRYDWVRFFPDGKRLLAGGRLAGGPMHLFTQPLDGGRPEPLNTNVYLVHPAISPDGGQIAGVDQEERLVIVPVAGGEPKVIATGFSPVVLGWSRQGKSLLAQYSSVSAKLLRVDLETGRYKPWKEIAPFDSTGVSVIWPGVISEDEQTFVYSFQRDLSELFVVDGWS
jgi:DNA-binding winged helix-turn-helix (wHTH) protein/Tol biopolymer transport system component